MALHPYAAYWNQGAANVPDMTGARHLLDGRDLEAVFASLEMDTPLGSVLDVGCGTGRLSRFADTYQGVDIAPSAVAYCEARDIPATLIASHEDLPSGPFDWVTCISVCTHIGQGDRMAYLMRFAQIAPNVLVDIIPGDGRGEVALWTADPATFEADIRRAGFSVVGAVDHAWDTQTHRYYRLRRAG